MKTNRISLGLMLIVGATASLGSAAGTLPLYGATVDKSSPACASFGDLVSCSAPLLNYLSGLDQGTTTANGGYLTTSPQGGLKDYIVLSAGGNAALDNSTISPSGSTGSQVENGFKSNTGGALFAATGKATGTTMLAGNLGDPTNNNLSAASDSIGTWDVSTSWLRDALTINGVRRELMFAFDYNQTQNATASINYWGLVTVRDVDGVKQDVNFEITNYTGQSYQQFSSSKNFYSQPNSYDFQAVSGTICLYAGGESTTSTAGKCPTTSALGNKLIQEIDNSQSTAGAEFVGFLPELNDQLDWYISQGYDTISVRLLFGCFNNSATDGKTGVGYLADSGATTNCDSGGFGDVFLMAGDPMGNQVPEPASLLLVAISFLGLGLLRRKC